METETVELVECRAPLTVQSFGLTERGQVHDKNEDNFLIAVLVKALHVNQTSLALPKLRRSLDKSYLFVVADGMGGQPGGEEASALAVDSVESYVLESLKWFSVGNGHEHDAVLADFRSALREASSRVQAEASERPELHGMGTTLTLAYSLNDELFVAHAGDSRCYLYRDDELHRLTRDHTLVADLVRDGVISAEEAPHHRWRHVITNFVGKDPADGDVDVDVHKLELEPGDVILLCSDGLTEMVDDEEISRILRSEKDPEPACRRLVERANGLGGRDNITVVVARFDSGSFDTGGIDSGD